MYRQRKVGTALSSRLLTALCRTVVLKLGGEGGILPPREQLAGSEDIFGCHKKREKQLKISH